MRWLMVPVLTMTVGLIGASECDSGGGDGGTAGDADSDADGDGDGDAEAEPCPSEFELVGPTGAGTGLCWTEPPDAHGDVHRARAVACAPDEDFPACGAGRGDCAADDECTEHAGGQCVVHEDGCSCVYTCSTDDDCGAGRACLCNGSAPERESVSWYSRCVISTCRTDADCNGYPCAVDADCCQQPEGLRCHGPGDECQSHADCPHGSDCVWEDDRWQCLEWCSCE
jgi:hypothetical protein